MDDRRWREIFDRVALFLAVLGILLREWQSGATAGVGFNLFIHLLFWIALTLWFAGRAFEGGATYRFTGFEFAFLAFAGLSLISVLRASSRLPALDHAFTYLSLSLLFVLAVNLLGKRTLLSILIATLFTMALYAVLQKAVLFPLMVDPEAAKTDSIEMVRRIRTSEVFGSFIGPNQLAGFLALLLPVVAGSMVDAREYRLRGVVLALGLTAIAMTGSLGGGVALACGAAAMGALALTRAKGRAIAVAAGAGAVVVAVALLLWTPLLSAAAKRSHSMHVRAVYWRATGPMIRFAPLLGVGLDNWEDHYTHTKSDVQQETRKAHNDYLQILAETGIAGFLAFAGILILGARKAFVRDGVPESDPDPPSPWLVAGVVATLVLFAVVGPMDGRDKLIAFVLGAAWLGFWLVLRRQTTGSDLSWTRMGAAGGFVALLVHMFVDFQIYEYGIAAMLFLALALLALLRGRATEVRLPRGVCFAAAGVLMLVTAPLLTFVTPRALAADGEIEEARFRLASLQQGRSAHPTQDISDALRLAESAQAHNPFDPEGYRAFAAAKFHEWDLLRKAGALNTQTLETAEGTVLLAFENALALRPLSNALHSEKGQTHLTFYRHYLKAGKDKEMGRAQAAEHLRLATHHLRRAYELYPTLSRNAYHLARVLELNRDPEAAKYYQEALRLSDLAGRELENLDRLKLEPIARARALRGTGHPLDAHDVVESYMRDRVKLLGPEQARIWLQGFPKLWEDEMDDTMGPVIKEVARAILRDLK